jgi:hypothetical protein
MITMTDRYAENITIDGSEVVHFPVPHSVYGVYGDDGIRVSLREGAQEGDQGVYTLTNGKAIIAHYTRADKLYISGTGTVSVWGGQSPLDDPFPV